jgi:hypothetical protein
MNFREQVSRFCKHFMGRVTNFFCFAVLSLHNKVRCAVGVVGIWKLVICILLVFGIWKVVICILL